MNRSAGLRPGSLDVAFCPLAGTMPRALMLPVLRRQAIFLKSCLRIADALTGRL